MSYLDLQQVITTDTLVMHLVVGIIGIASVLVFDKSKACWVSSMYLGGPRRRILTACLKPSAAQECRNARGDRSFEALIRRVERAVDVGRGD